MASLGLLSRLSTLAVRLFYRLEVRGAAIPREGPVLLVANHPNALIDAACVFAAAGRPVRFLAKSPLFRMPVLGWLIRSSGAIPVYRRQDDPGQMRRNVQGLQEAFRALDRGRAVGIFPEGRSHGEPAISALRSGAARIALGALDEVSECFPIVPLGLSFSAKDRFRSEALVLVGEPIEWVDLNPRGGGDAPKREAVRELTARIDEGLRRVTLNLEQWEDAPLVACAEAVHRAEMAAAPAEGNAEEKLDRSRHVAVGLKGLRRRDPERLASLLPAVARYHRVLSFLGLRPEDLDESPGPGLAFRRLLPSLLLLFVSLPVLVAGTVLFALPYVATDRLARLKRWTPEERSTVKILGGTVFYLIWFLLLSCSVGSRWSLVLGCLAFPLLWGLAWTTQWLRDLWSDVSRELRLAMLLGNRETLREKLLEKRRGLAREIEDARVALMTLQQDAGELARQLQESAREGRLPQVEGEGRAAVAAVLRQGRGGLEVLLIRRAEHPRDPWSGHMGFPGGRVDDGDADALAAAIRECREEMALDLTAAGQLLGPLAHLPAIGRGRPQGLVIEPFVFLLTTSPPAFRLNHEVEETLWVPLDFFRDHGNRSTRPWQFEGRTVRLPCYNFEGRTIWGLTLAMIDDLLSRFQSV
jgi:1-acyl-sn-glycerol-3-phosphate acyltransferase